MGRPSLIAAGVALLGAFAPPASAALSADSMLAPTTVVAIDLQLPPASVAALEDDPDEYVEGTFSLAETTGTPASVGPYSTPITVGVRLKGTAGFRGLSGKAAFKVKFNEFIKGQKFLGLKRMTLNNMIQDPSMVREALAYDAFRAAGIAAPHAGYAYVRLNGIDYGLHLNLETLDDVALEKRFGEFQDPPQHLYEGSADVDVVPGGAAAFEVDEGDEEARGDLEALIAAANAPAPDFSTRMAAVADLEQMTQMWAAERYLAHWDGYVGTPPNNYYLYSDAAGVFQMLPWGTDQTLVNWWMPFSGKGGLLFRQCLAEAACAEAYAEALTEVGESTTALDLPTQASQLTTLLAPWQAQEIAQSERAPYDAEQIEDAVADVLHFLAVRPAALAKWLGTGEEPSGEAPLLQEPGQPLGPISAVPSAPLPASLSRRLDVDRSMLARGVLITRVAVPAAGKIRQVGQIATESGPLQGCATELAVAAAGAPAVRCRLSPAVRKRLSERRLTLQLETRFEPGNGVVSTVSRAVVIPRQAPD